MTFNSFRYLKGFPCGSPASKESACIAGDLDLIPGLERSPGEEKGYPLQYSGLENSPRSGIKGAEFAPNVYWNANQCCFKRNLYYHPQTLHGIPIRKRIVFDGYFVKSVWHVLCSS